MDVLVAASTVLRRWRITVPVTLLTIVLAVTLASRVSTSYVSTSSVLIAAPAVDPQAGYNGQDVETNPLLKTTNQILGPAVTATIQVLDTPEIHARTEVDGATYAMKADLQSPIIHITAAGPTPDSALATLQKVTENVDESLLDIEDGLGASPKARLKSTVIQQQRDATPASGDRVKVAGAVGAGGGLLMLLLAFAAEGRARTRETRHRKKKNGAPLDLTSNGDAAPVELWSTTALHEPIARR
jgi:hypothetical protein